MNPKKQHKQRVKHKEMAPNQLGYRQRRDHGKSKIINILEPDDDLFWCQCFGCGRAPVCVHELARVRTVNQKKSTLELQGSLAHLQKFEGALLIKKNSFVALEIVWRLLVYRLIVRRLIV